MSSVEVTKYPSCYFCRMGGKKELAKYDGRTKSGESAYMCAQHFKEHGVGLGTGRGQKLILYKEKQCSILPNHHVRRDGNCVRFATCQTQGRTIDSHCKARGQVQR